MTAALAPSRPGLLAVERARVMLAEATRTDEVKKIRDVAVAMKAYARTQKAGKEIALDAGEIILRADARMGALARELPKTSAPGPGRGNKTKSDARTSLKRDALESVGVTKQRAAEFEKVASLSSKELDTYVATERKNGHVPSTSGAVQLARMPESMRGKALAKLGDLGDFRKVANELRREGRIAKLVETSKNETPLTGELGRFPILYVDPPWRYEHIETESRAIENQYPTMALEEICALSVGKRLATDDAVLFLWATSPKLAEAMHVLDAWAFTYRTCMVWVKDKIGMGYYARQKHELLLIATRGEPPTPMPSDRPSSVVESPRGKHSEKPAIFYELIERMYPELARVELFARRARDGWARWGNEA
jgi:N6-adenosine-specific RNA methylase IME4